jgi:N-acyl-L-homoserine lactone synthetase
MLSIINFKGIKQNPDLFFGQHELRHREFILRQNYDVKTVDSMEFDQYDTLVSQYLVYSEDGKTVLGASRLTPISYGCMLADHFPGLVDDKSLFQTERPVWEGTRFVIDSRLPAEKRRLICHHICCGYIEFGLARGIDEIIGLMQTAILRSVFERSGIVLNRLGDPQAAGQHSKVQAASIAISQAQLDRVAEVTGLHNVLGLAAGARTANG